MITHVGRSALRAALLIAATCFALSSATSRLQLRRARQSRAVPQQNRVDTSGPTKTGAATELILVRSTKLRFPGRQAGTRGKSPHATLRPAGKPICCGSAR